MIFLYNLNKIIYGINFILFRLFKLLKNFIPECYNTFYLALHLTHIFIIGIIVIILIYITKYYNIFFCITNT